MIFSEHFGKNRVIILQAVEKWLCIKLCAFFLGHSVEQSGHIWPTFTLIELTAAGGFVLSPTESSSCNTLLFTDHLLAEWRTSTVVLQFRQMLNDELSTPDPNNSATDKGVSAYITQTFLGNNYTLSVLFPGKWTSRDRDRKASRRFWNRDGVATRSSFIVNPLARIC